MGCNHVWRDTPLPTAKDSKDTLLASIVDSGPSGWWLHEKEFDFAQQLFDDGSIFYCDECGPRLAVFATAKKRQCGNLSNNA